jgi:hypothetical protein
MPTEKDDGLSASDIAEIKSSRYGFNAAILAELTIDISERVHRRVDRVEWVGERIVRRQILLDLTLPQAPAVPGDPPLTTDPQITVEDSAALSGHSTTIPFPITLFNKSEVIGFAARDHVSGLLPYLNMKQNRRLTTRMLLAMITRVVGRERQLPRSLWDDVWTLTGPTSAAVDAHQRLLASIQEMSGSPTGNLGAILEELVGNFYMIVLIENVRPLRRVVELAYDEYVVNDRAKMRLHRRRPHHGVLRYSDAAITMPVGMAATYHAEVQAPQGTEFPGPRQVASNEKKALRHRDQVKTSRDEALRSIDTRLAMQSTLLGRWAVSPGRRSRTPASWLRWLVSGGWEAWRVARTRARWQRRLDEANAQVDVARLVRAWGVGAERGVTSYRTLLNVRLRAAHRSARVDILRCYDLTPGTMWPALLVVVGTAVLLAAGLLLRPFGVRSQPSAAAAVLVAVPVLFVAALIRPDEHPVTKDLLRRVRGAAYASGALSFLAACSLAVTFPVVSQPQSIPLIGRPLAWLESQDIGLRGPVWLVLTAAAIGPAVTVLTTFLRLGRYPFRVQYWLDDG